MPTLHWTFIGAGNMASSLIGGLINSNHPPQDLSVYDINPDACTALQKRFDVSIIDDINNTPANSGVVIAVKPNVVASVCTRLKATRPILVVSVAAGVRESTIASLLHQDAAIIRCMPNTPALLGLGATALFANAACDAQKRTQGEELLATAGKVVWVGDESELDAVTALSGSGPAYFFYLIEHMISAGTELGLDAEVARELAIETAFGAASMARLGEHSPSTLRENVTSKGGTTAAALDTFNQHDTAQIIAKAMQAAKRRATELGDEFSAEP